jgi:RNA polymerase sigma-70 factor (ECF subfamily)
VSDNQILAQKPIEDATLITQFQNETTRTQAFEALVRKYQRRLYGHIRHMVISHADTDDLLQEVFVKVWQHLANFRGEAQLQTWLYRIATNECLSFLRKKRLRFWHPLQEQLTEALESGVYIEGDKVQLALQRALLTLPDKQRLVFNMRYFEELPYEQMSEILGTSVGALKASYHLAVKKIEKHLAQTL